MIRDTPSDVELDVVAVPRPALHQALTHAVAEGRGRVAVLDSVWAAEFAAAGFLARGSEQGMGSPNAEVDFVDALVAAGRYGPDVRRLGVRGRRQALVPASRLDGLGFLPRRAAQRGTSAARERHASPDRHAGGSRGGGTAASCLISFLASNGADVLRAEGEPRLAPNRLSRSSGLVDDGLMSADVVARVGSSRTPARRGEAAINFGGSYEAATLPGRSAFRFASSGITSGFAPIPGGQEGRPRAWQGRWCTGSSVRQLSPRSLMRLLEDVVAPEALARIATATGRIPCQRSAVALSGASWHSPEPDHNLLDHAVTRPTTPVYPRASGGSGTNARGRSSRAASAPRRRRSGRPELIAAITGLAIVDRAEVTAPPASVQPRDRRARLTVTGAG